MRVLDIGAKFGMDVAHVFSPWNHSTVLVDSIATADKVMDDVDLVCFGGGEDIHNSLYHHQNVASSVGQIPSRRDLFEVEIWKLAVERKKPILGICRGAQLACALSGGSLIQDVDNHAHGNGHKLTTIDKRDVFMSSLHHQLMHPGNVNHELIAWTTGRIKRIRYDTKQLGKDIKVPMEKEPEIIFFPDTNALAIQGHPEFYEDPMVPPVVYTRDLCEQYLGVHP